MKKMEPISVADTLRKMLTANELARLEILDLMRKEELTDRSTPEDRRRRAKILMGS